MPLLTRIQTIPRRIRSQVITILLSLSQAFRFCIRVGVYCLQSIPLNQNAVSMYEYRLIQIQNFDASAGKNTNNPTQNKKSSHKDSVQSLKLSDFLYKLKYIAFNQFPQNQNVFSMQEYRLIQIRKFDASAGKNTNNPTQNKKSSHKDIVCLLYTSPSPRDQA